ncbi:unnamed protein product [Rhodiola kirilowii]
MADSDSKLEAPPSIEKDSVTPLSSKILELSESRAELLNRIQHLKKDLQNWRSNMDTQVTTYRNDLSNLKKTLDVEVDQLKSEFQDLRNTLKQQQEVVTANLRNLGLEDNLVAQEEAQIPKSEGNDEAEDQISSNNGELDH